MRCGRCNQWQVVDNKARCPHLKAVVDEYDDSNDMKCGKSGIGKPRDFPEPSFDDELEAEEDGDFEIEDVEEDAEEDVEETFEQIVEEEEVPKDTSGEVVEVELTEAQVLQANLTKIEEETYEIGASLEDAMARLRNVIAVIREIKDEPADLSLPENEE